MRKHGGGRRAIAHAVIRFVSRLLDEFRADVLPLVFQLNFLRDRYAVKRHLRRTIALFNNNGAAARAERHRHRRRQFVYALLDRRARVFIELDLFCHFNFL